MITEKIEVNKAYRMLDGRIAFIEEIDEKAGLASGVYMGGLIPHWKKAQWSLFGRVSRPNKPKTMDLTEEVYRPRVEGHARVARLSREVLKLKRALEIAAPFIQTDTAEGTRALEFICEVLGKDELRTK